MVVVVIRSSANYDALSLFCKNFDYLIKELVETFLKNYCELSGDAVLHRSRSALAKRASTTLRSAQDEKFQLLLTNPFVNADFRIHC